MSLKTCSISYLKWVYNYPKIPSLNRIISTKKKSGREYKRMNEFTQKTNQGGREEKRHG